MSWETIIGLEIHAQLATRTKAFCGCANRYGDEPNTNVCPVCLGLPGALPVANRKAVELGLRLALALGCAIRERSIWARKNYFYPDLPKGYQISQFDRPLATGGLLPVRLKDGAVKNVGITRLHLEEDAGKSFHGEGADLTASLIDLNRCGVPLAEIVSEPDLRSPDEAWAYMKALRQLVVQLGVGKGNLEEGNLRCDANLSVRKFGEEGLRSRREIKNLNSFKFLRLALEYERSHQIAVYEAGGMIESATLLFDSARGETFVMRSKEEAHDYRYFPEPDLPPLIVVDACVAHTRKKLPELPWEIHARFVEQYALSGYDAAVLTDNAALGAYYERVAARCDAKQAANWVMGDLAALLKERALEIEQSPVGPEMLAEMIKLIEKGTISGKIAKEVLAAMADGEGSAGEIVGKQGLTQLSDEKALAALIDEVLAENPQQLAQLRAGKDRLFGFFVGQVMKKTKGQANPRAVNKLLTEKLNG